MRECIKAFAKYIHFSYTIAPHLYIFTVSNGKGNPLRSGSRTKRKQGASIGEGSGYFFVFHSFTR